MKKQSIANGLVAALLLGSTMTLLSSCATTADSASDSKEFGHLEMALSGGGVTTGATYRLRHAVISVSGPTVDLHQTEDNPDQPSVTFNVPPGEYDVALTGESGPNTWQLERLTANGTYEDVDASLISLNPQKIEVESGTIRYVSLRFILDGDEVVLEPGSIYVSLSVFDGPQCTLLSLDQGCTSSQHCAPINGTVGTCEAAGPVALGGVCTSNTDCVMGACAFSDGQGICYQYCIPAVLDGGPGSCPAGQFCSPSYGSEGATGYGLCF